jgi:23S rRNA (uridine2552-2'-O)-methyltransferase
VYKRKDTFYGKAKKEGYRSRAAYKLIELAGREKVVLQGDFVIDAGAAPGGWSQVLLGIVGKKGKVAAVDILPMDPLPGENFRFFPRDITDNSLPSEIVAFFGRRADAVLSDAAPNTTGISFADQARSADLVRSLMALARETLRDGGTLLAKIFEGAEAEDVVKEMRVSFGNVRRIRPAATRKESSELYLLARKYRGD